jgi:uncharacterized Zn finger protein (UPF0148 family)
MRAGSLLQGAPVLNCPGCGTKVADGTSICPSCDYIIDASFISTDVPEDAGDDDAVVEEAPPPRPARSSAGARGTASRPAVGARTGATGARPAVGSRPGTGARPAVKSASPERDTAIKSMDEIQRNAPPRAAGGRPGTGARPAVGARTGATGARPAAAPPPPAYAPADSDDEPESITGGSQIADPEELISDFRRFVGSLSSSDKIAFSGAAVLVISCFLPWKETADEGDILGLMSLGLVGLLAAATLMGTIAVRTRRLLPNLNVLIPWLLQLGLSLFSILWCIIFMKLSYDSTEVLSPMGNAMIRTSTPSFGVFLGLLGAVASLAGTLLGLKEKPA